MAPEQKHYDVFLCHSSRDKDAVEKLAYILQAKGLQPFFDSWHLVPGEPWQEGLERGLQQSRTCAVFLGSPEEAPWRDTEMRVALDQRARFGIDRVIPVLLPEVGLPKPEDLPFFLGQLKWVEFRHDLADEQAIYELICGIEGRKPVPLHHKTDVNPFRGVEPFYAAHAKYFFGREGLIQQMVDALRRSHFLALVGPPGIGKSSVVRAGLIPTLKQGALPGSPDWEVLDLTPSFHPLDQLVDQLTQLFAPTSGPVEKLRLRQTLCQDHRTLHLELQKYLKGRNSTSSVCFLIDPLENLFELAQSEPERQAFLGNLLHAAGVFWGRAVVITTLRTDLLTRLGNYYELNDYMASYRIIVPPMTEIELRQAIERPVDSTALSFDPGLVNIILRDLQGQMPTLPLLQHTLLELWKRRENGRLTTTSYVAIGQINGVFTSWAEGIYKDLSAAQQTTARRIFLRLMRGIEDRNGSPSRVRLSELLNNRIDPTDIDYVVERFASSHLLTVTRDTNDESDKFVNLAHEGLRECLRSWIEESGSTWRIQSWFEENVRNWQSHGRDASSLMRGAELAEIERWSFEHGRELNELEREFLEASLANRGPIAKKHDRIQIRYARPSRRHE